MINTFAPALVVEPAALVRSAGLAAAHAVLHGLYGQTVTYSSPASDEGDGWTVSGVLAVGPLDVDYADRLGFTVNVTNEAEQSFVAAAIRTADGDTLDAGCWHEGAAIILH